MYNSKTETLILEKGFGDIKIFKDKCKIIVFKGGIIEIDDHTFYGFSKLEHVYLPPTVQYIGRYSFSDCPNLVKINFPDSLVDFMDGAFAGSGITEVTFGDNVNYVGDYCFNNCKSLTGVNFTQGAQVKRIGIAAFEGCERLQLNLIKVDYIALAAFSHCSALSQITIQGKDVRISSEAFAWCKNLSKVVVERCQIIREQAFVHSGIREIEIHSNNRTLFDPVPQNQFKGCSNLTNITTFVDVQSSYADIYSLKNSKYILTNDESVTITKEILQKWVVWAKLSGCSVKLRLKTLSGDCYDADLTQMPDPSVASLKMVAGIDNCELLGSIIWWK